MAKTYSMIKDKVGKRIAPLDAFLRLVCPAMGIIAARHYLVKLNWIVTLEDGGLTITRVALPDLTSFDRATLCCDMSHIDLLRFVLDTNYLHRAKEFAEDIRDDDEEVMTPTMTPDAAKKAFADAIANDAMAVAAQIFGLSVDHVFLDISQNSKPDEHTRAYELPVMASVKPAPALTPQPQHMMGPYPWTGNILHLYQADDMVLDLDGIVGMDAFVVTDVNNPVDFDDFLETAGGHKADDLFPDCKSMQVLQMKLADHSQCLTTMRDTTSPTHSNQRHRSSNTLS
jgi:hypothetical protein